MNLASVAARLHFFPASWIQTDDSCMIIFVETLSRAFVRTGLESTFPRRYYSLGATYRLTHAGPRNVGSSHLGPVVYKEIQVMSIREQLEALSNRELLGKERMAELREEEINEQLVRLEVRLKEMSDEDLLGEDWLAELREEEIERRLGISDDQ